MRLVKEFQGSLDAEAKRDDLVAAAEPSPRAGAAPADASRVTPASMANAGALPAGRRGRRRGAAHTAGQGRRAVLLAILGALVVAGLLTYDFLHLRRAGDASNTPTAAGVPAVAAPDAPPAAVPPPAVAVPPAKAPSESPLDSRSTAPAGEAATRALRPNPEASLAEKAALLELAQAAFDEGKLDRAQSEAHRAAALGSSEADALLGAIAFKRGHLDEAERLLSKALERDPGNPRIARQLQVVRVRQGR